MNSENILAQLEKHESIRLAALPAGIKPNIDAYVDEAADEFGMVPFVGTEVWRGIKLDVIFSIPEDDLDSLDWNEVLAGNYSKCVTVDSYSLLSALQQGRVQMADVLELFATYAKKACM